MIRFIGISVLGLAIAAPFAPSAHAQTVNSGNYRSYARCSETVIDGKVYSTFGPGPCPPGTKYSPSYGSYENDMAMRRSQAAVDALGQAQQALMAWGQAMADRSQRESEQILRDRYIDLDVSDAEIKSPMYENTRRVFPRIETLSIAQAGGVLFSTQGGQYAECIIPAFSHEKKAIGGWTYTILPQEPACKFNEKAPAYTPMYANGIGSISSYKFVIPLMLKKKSDKIDACFRYQGLSTACKKGVEIKDVSFSIGFLGDRSLTTDVVSYAGVRGDSLLFLYRPGGFPDQSRPDRVEEVTANLSESRVVKVGPYTFEVVDWSPTNIVAKLVAVD